MSEESGRELTQLAQAIQTRLLCRGEACQRTHRCQDQITWLRRQFHDLQRAQTWRAFLDDAGAAQMRTQLDRLAEGRAELATINAKAYPPLTPAEDARKQELAATVGSLETKLVERRHEWIRVSAERRGCHVVGDCQQRIGSGNTGDVFPCTNARGDLLALKATREFRGWFFENEVATLRLVSSQSKGLTPLYVTHWATPLAQCIVMERFGSDTLHTLFPQLMERSDQVLQEVQRMIDELAALGIDHGDLHLKNILVDVPHHGPISTRMVDFGFAVRGISPAVARDAMWRRFDSEWKLRLAQAAVH
jgi:hypothetical protein